LKTQDILTEHDRGKIKIKRKQQVITGKVDMTG
jgi:hypothetical protein